ncbi:Putative ribonuclease H protein At1g65750, partial [Linum perenne]
SPPLTANLGSCSIIREELRAAELGLQLAWNLGLHKVILQLDSQPVVSVIEGHQSDDTRHSPIIHQIQLLPSLNWQTKVFHIYREANQVADLLAHLGHSQALGTHTLDSLPPNICNALRSDCIGVSFPITISSNN